MSQGSYNVPTGGSISMVAFAALMNGAYNALASQSSGASNPVNGPGNAPLEFQNWFNTTNVNFPVKNVFDGVNWDRIGTLDVVGSNWLPKMGGGIATLASASTVNIGASPQTFITISGIATINSFGTAATIGEERKLQFSSSLILVYNASFIITPSLSNLVTKSGDTCTAIYQGAGVWVIWGYTRGTALPGLGLPTGAVFWMPFQTLAIPISGAVKANGGTIGNVGTAASLLASADTLTLFTVLWNNLPNSVCPVSGGRGATGIADFFANKTIGVPDLRGRVLAGLDDMGAAAASRLTSLTMTPDGITPMATGGAESLVFLQANLPNVNWTVTDPGHTHSLNNAGSLWQNGGGTNLSGAGNTLQVAVTVNTATTGISVASGGSGTAMKILQPTVTGTHYICL